MGEKDGVERIGGAQVKLSTGAVGEVGRCKALGEASGLLAKVPGRRREARPELRAITCSPGARHDELGWP